LGWKTAWLSEIEPFPSAVLAHHYPDVPNLGDMTTLPERILSGEVEAPDVFCGGTPCQAFSVAGLRNSLDDARGNLSLTFVGIANAIDNVRSARGEQPAIVFWENVPGVLSTKDNAFGCFISGLAGEEDPVEPPRGKWTNAGVVLGPQRTVAWRILDAQYFGVAQRRRRVFVVASARDDFDPASVLFEFDSVRRDTAPSREKGQAIAPCVTNGPPFSRTGNERVEAEAMVVAARMVAFGEYSVDGTASAMKARDYKDATDLVAQPITYGIRTANTSSNGWGIQEEVTHTLDCAQSVAVAQPIGCFKGGQGSAAGGIGYDEHISPTLNAADSGSNRTPALMQGMAVRRLTPVECERLQGFPDNYTNIPWRKKDESPDGPRYKALGNSWAVPNVRWIGQRIQENLK
jgi:DNA (cytosine-5)-methyltransferase 1